MPRRRVEEEAPRSTSVVFDLWRLYVSVALFFIMLFALSTIDVARFKEVISSIQGARGSGRWAQVLNPSDIPVPKPLLRLALGPVELKLAGLMKEIERQLIKEGNLSPDKVSFKIDERGLVITFLDAVFFDVGKANLKPGVFPSWML